MGVALRLANGTRAQGPQVAPGINAAVVAIFPFWLQRIVAHWGQPGDDIAFGWREWDIEQVIGVGHLAHIGMAPPTFYARAGFAQLADDFWSLGYAGLWSWAYNDPAFPWDGDALRGYAAQHACETSY